MASCRPITQAQRAALFRALAAACAELGHGATAEREAYRKRVMWEECGKRHLAELNRTTDYDAVMRRFAADAGDYAAAAGFAIADSARRAALVRICCAQVMQLKGCALGTTEAAEYLAGIVEQARIACGRDLRDSSFWMDCAPDNLLVLFQILDTHRRRLLRGMIDGRTARCFMGFDHVVVYQPLPTGGVRLIYDARAYDTLTHIRINIRSAAA
ncbi:MAG: hypothetical protein IKF72_06445 [Kiritimatiellae bacterium]|nr:hypothetical protein [Kiritimatiellia bacterium]